MKIGLACNGEGFGHVSRTVAFYEALCGDYQVAILAPPTVHGFLSQKAPDALVLPVPHMHLVKITDRIDYYRTFTENLPTLLTLRTKIVRMSRMLKDHNISVLINDYEPFSAVAAKRIGIPVLQFNHPGIVITSPSFSPDALAVKAAARFMMPVFDKRIFCSFYNGDVGPMIRRELTEVRTRQGDYFLVSLKDSYRPAVLKRLHQMGIHNYRLFPDPRESYAEAVAGCRAIITSAGHQTLSEAMYLKKPVFAIPQRGQYEQRLNARMLAASGWGSYSSIRTLKTRLAAFIRDLDAGRYPQKPHPLFRFSFDNDSERIIRKIRSFIHQATKPQIINMWSVIFPDDEAPEDLRNLWGRLARRTPEMEDLRESSLRRQFQGENRRRLS